MIPQEVQLQQTKPIIVDIIKPISNEDRIKELETKLASIAQMFYMFKRMGLPRKVENQVPKNSKNNDNIPLNSCYMGYVDGSEFPYILVVNEEGIYNIGNKTFTSLATATAHVYGENKNGLNLWQSLDGIYLNELVT
jgi:hypothetical protein